ncbi:hypothetical protein AC249_AIPGENE5087, partial [Exaiptasia diaphana]
ANNVNWRKRGFGESRMVDILGNPGIIFCRSFLTPRNERQKITPGFPRMNGRTRDSYITVNPPGLSGNRQNLSLISRSPA